MNRWYVIVTLIILGGALLVWAFDAETKKIMPFLENGRECHACHSTDAEKVLANPAVTCDAFCISCHKNITSQNHHSTGIKAQDLDSRGFHLTRLGKIACVTCHDLHEDRFDSYPWIAQSLFDSMFKKQDHYKTYYLIVQNNKGQLCRTCH
ncbi:MAG TPA: hypothetical protein PK926_14890 [Spirochaetota bacterium]|nr:hypothetical protein [Spirochaetota bacterium]HPI89654.1 hypothetical protein [Spirochaetota bacterium]HPR49760.1 hypothetical protein [Spirochaetota bacterium]